MSLLNRLRKYSTKVVFIYDSISVILSWWLAYFISYNFKPTSYYLLAHNLNTQFIVLSIHIFFNSIFRTNKPLWRFYSVPGLLSLLKAVSCGWFCSFIFFKVFLNTPSVPNNIWFIYPAWLLLFLNFGRLVIRLSNDKNSESGEVKRVLIIGGGKGAELFLRDIKRWKDCHYVPIACLDDDTKLKGKEIRGIPIIGALDLLEKTVKNKQIDMVVIAIPSMPADILRKLVNICEQLKVTVKILPSLSEILEKKDQAVIPREISLEDLLGRDPVNLDKEGIRSYLTGKVVLVSGGGGSIGSELCNQIAKFEPKKLIVLDHSEFNLYQAEMSLKKNGHKNIEIALISITDLSSLRQVMKKFRPSIVFHAAAYKHVPILEDQMFQAVKNNILGTTFLADAAVESGVEKFVMVSTDKAVNPTNIMGATKRVAEIFCRTYNKYTKTSFVTVRFGNVIGSSGSVIPLFKNQIEKGETLTITHPNITRYFMTIKEAAQLILQAGYQGNGGEIFVLDMGQPVKILDIAKQLIQLYGKKESEVEIVYTGLRPGEKMYEELFYEAEPLSKTVQDKIFKSNTEGVLSLDKMQEAVVNFKLCTDLYDLDLLISSLNSIQNFSTDILPKINTSVEMLA